jgi:putative endopeptidase
LAIKSKSAIKACYDQHLNLFFGLIGMGKQKKIVRFNFVLLGALVSGVLLQSCASVATAPAGKPEFGVFGLDQAGMDTTIKPGHDFYQFANGTWAKNTPIPPDRSNYGLFNRLNDLSDARTKKIIERISSQAHAPDSEPGKVANFYSAFMDEAAIEANGMKPVQAILNAVDQVKTREQLFALMAQMARVRTGAPINVSIAVDLKNPQAHIGYLSQGGLGLPDKDMYDVNNPVYAAQRAGYLQMIETIFTLAKLSDAAARARDVYKLEEKIARAHWNRVDSRNPDKTYNKFTAAQLAELAPQMNWPNYLQPLGLAQEPTINVSQPNAVKEAIHLLSTEPIATWQDYARLRWLASLAPLLPKAFENASFEFTDKVLSGTPSPLPRWKRGVDRVTATLGEIVGKQYASEYFTQATKDKALTMVNNIMAVMGQRVDGLSWMSAQTKVKAREKLSTYNTKIGFPDKWRDYSALEVRAGDPVGNSLRAAAFSYERSLARLGKPADKTEWFMTPMTVNAYYSALGNEIVFPAAILQPPFFDPNADDAINYGAIGGVIGHEITHGFDDNGSRFDSQGKLNNWWTESDRNQFNAAAQRLIEQYNQYCPFPASGTKTAQCVQGALTIGENIADLAGLTIAYEAYKKSLNGKPAAVLNGMTGDQRFFLGWAQSWRRNMRDTERQNRLLTGAHSPEPYRAAVVRNLDAWYNAFDVKPGDALYLAPQDRIKIW